MKKSKTKVIVIVSIIVLIVASLAVGAILFFMTDVFKSNQELFYKYMAQNSEVIEILQKDGNEQNASNILEQSKYKTEGKVAFELTSNNTQIANQAVAPRNFTIDYTSKTDEVNKKASSETTIKFLTKDLFTLKYLRNEDLYALKSDEVLNKYLALDNNNLKEFAQKMGIAGAVTIPNKIEDVNVNEVLQLSQQDQNTIIQKSMTIINNKIPKDRYTKKKNVAITVDNKEVIANAYKIELTQEELKSITKTILEDFQEDEAILNIFLNNTKLLIGEQATTKDIQTVIKGVIEELDKQETENDSFILSVYEKEGNLIKTAIENAKGNVISIDIARSSNAKRAIINFEYNSNSTAIQNYKVKSIEIATKSIDNESEKDYIFTLENGDEITKLAIQNKVTNNLENGSLDRNIIMNFDFSNTTYFTVKLTSKSIIDNTLEIEELNTQNSVKVNDFTKEYTDQLIRSITERLVSLYNQKMQVIMITQQENATNSTTGNNTDTNQISQNQTNL